MVSTSCVDTWFLLQFCSLQVQNLTKCSVILKLYVIFLSVLVLWMVHSCAEKSRSSLEIHISATSVFPLSLFLACVDAKGIFTSVNSERPRSVGESFTYNHSSLKQNIDTGAWLHVSHSRIINGQELVDPF